MAIGGNKKKRIMSSEELSSFCDQIALMLSSGMTLRDGIEMLAEDEMKEKNLKVRPYTNLYKVVDETGSLYVAMKENEEEWPSYMIEMVDIGEQTGRLEDIMLSLSTYYQREGRIRSAAVSAITYPLVLGVMLVVIIGILLWRVLPIFRRVLASLGVGSSSSGSVLMQIGTWVGWGVLILIGLVVLAAIVIAILMKTKAREKTLKFLKDKDLLGFVDDSKKFLAEFPGKIYMPVDVAYEKDGSSNKYRKRRRYRRTGTCRCTQ